VNLTRPKTGPLSKNPSAGNVFFLLNMSLDMLGTLWKITSLGPCGRFIEGDSASFYRDCMCIGWMRMQFMVLWCGTLQSDRGRDSGDARQKPEVLSLPTKLEMENIIQPNTNSAICVLRLWGRKFASANWRLCDAMLGDWRETKAHTSRPSGVHYTKHVRVYVSAQKGY
jgi:hypothetical protein